MRGRTVVKVIAGALASAVLWPGAAAQAADRCAAQLERVTASAPRYVHVADRFDVTVGQDAEIFEYVVANAAVEANGARVAIEVPDDGEAATPLRAPLKPREFEVVVTWDQTASPERPDTPPCAARRVLKVTALPAKAVIGDPARPRIEGRWQLSFAPIGTSGRSGRYRSKLLTDCDVGGCRRIAIDGEILRWDGGVYRKRKFTGYHPCKVENYAGADYTIKRAWRIYEEYALRTVASTPGPDGLPRATRLEGEARLSYELTGKTNKVKGGCNRDFVFRNRIILRKL